MPAEFIFRVGYPWVETPERLEAALDFVRRAGGDRVMFFNNRGHAEPAHYTREETLRRAAVLGRALARARELGLRAAINNLATVGMNFSPPRKERLPFQGLVDYDGKVFPECYCPLDPAWLDYVDFLFSTWAGLGPDEVWVDDDFRYKTGAAQCFCPLHLAEFEKESGKRFTREELLPAITSGPAPASGTLRPNELAHRWGRMQNRVLLDAMRRIAAAVKRTDPKVGIGFMGLVTSTYQYGADYLHEIGRIIAPDRPVPVRPEFGGYSDEARNSWNVYFSLWCCRRAFGDRFVGWPEGENWPNTRFTHSRAVMRMKIAWAAVHGLPAITFTEVEMIDPASLGDEPGRTDYLAAAKRFSGAIAKAVEAPGLRPAGVAVELPENKIGLRAAPAYTDFNFNGIKALARLGVPLWPHTRSVTGEDESDPAARHARIVIDNAALVREKELAGFAREGLLLDRAAFEHLAAMGRDDLLGGARPAPRPGPPSGYPCLERFAEHELNRTAAGRPLSMEVAANLRAVLQATALPDHEAFTTLSWFEDQDGARLWPGTWTRQWDGGRLAVLPFSLNDAQAENAIVNWKRKAQLEGLLEWLAGQPLPVRVVAAADLQTVYRQSADGSAVLIALANFSNDDAEGGELVVPALADGRGRRLRVLGPAGRWIKETAPIGAGGLVSLRGKLVVPSMEVRLVEWRVV